MIRIAIVEDDKTCQQQLTRFIHRYEDEKKEKFDIFLFSDGEEIISGFTANYDIIFMDIQMKKMNGMEAAKKIRQYDENVIIIFITNMAQYAVQGYAVNALDYVLKPIQYFPFSQELDNAVKRLSSQHQDFLSILQDGNMIRVCVSQIQYIESQGHKIIVHTGDEEISFRSTMRKMEEKLMKNQFVRCNNCYLVNLRYVERVKENIAVVAGNELQISRSRRKDLMEALADYIGGGC